MWIKVDDEKPKDEQWVLVTHRKQVGIAQYLGGFGGLDAFYLNDKEVPVTHWMPFPKPPK